MKSRTLVDEIIDLIDGYKIVKIDELVKKIKSDLNGLIGTDDKRFEVIYLNALEPIDLKNTERLFSEIYDFDFSDEFKEWLEYQYGDEYKSQSLKTKITNKVKKEIIGKETKDDVKRILNQYKLTYDLDSALEIIKRNLSGELLQVIEQQQVIWLQRLSEINEKYDYANWLDWASSNAKNVSFATHIAKLTHSGISGANNIYFDKVETINYLSTTSLKNKEIEISQSNNALAPIGKLLQLHSGNEILSEKLKNGDLTAFERFTESDEKLSQWRKGFLAVFSEKDLATHYLAKQMYFPINNDSHCEGEDYHLINPMMSSSLDQKVFEKINFTKYSKEMVEIRKQKKEGKFHPDEQESFPNLAILKVTSGDKTSKAHMNVSPLNIKRVGGRYLFPSMPPTWQKMESPPLKQKTIFSGEFEKRARESTKELQKYLIKLQDIKFGNKSIRDQIKQHINNIINTLFDYVLEVQAMPSGWSEKSKLEEKSHAHALWLDSNRDDKAFQEKRKNGQWQEIVCQDFGLWMNSQLSNKDMKLVKFEKNKWAKLLKNRLNLFDKGWGASK